MSAGRLTNLDLNLLVALDALLQQAGVTRAAEQVGLSQPAMSGALARLRRHFDDPLLVRTGNSFRLTPLAVQLRHRARIAVVTAERAFSPELDVDPASSTREVRILINDYGTAVLGGPILAILAAEAPGIRLRLVSSESQPCDDVERLLTRYDLVVAPHGLFTDLPHQDLHDDRWICVSAADNPSVGDQLSLDDLRELRWVVTYSGRPTMSLSGRAIGMNGLEPQVQAITEHFLAVPSLVAGSQRVALLPHRLAVCLRLEPAIKVLACPLEVPPLVEAMWWHPAYTEDPEHQWLRGVVARAAAALPALPNI